MQLAAASRYPLLSVDEVQQRIAVQCRPLPAERVRFDAALGRVLAEDVRAPEPLPPFRSAAVDGYAVRAADGDAPRRVVAEIVAGVEPTVPLGPGEAAWVTTGAPLPEGADAVVMVEQTAREGDLVRLSRAPQPGDGFHRIGESVAEGQVLLEKGTIVGPAEIGILATTGVVEVAVYRRPVVAVLSTGDELVEPGAPRRGATIRDSNRYALMAAIEALGAIPLSLGIARDVAAEHEAKMREGLARADVLITSGGVSMGNRDLIKDILEAWGTVHVGRVAFKPGKPLTFAVVDGKLIFGLPGFPVSSLVTFEVFVRPALLRLMGARVVERPRVRVSLAQPAKPSPDRTEYQRAVVRWADGRLVATATGVQASHRLMSMVGANALLIIAPGEEPLPAGSEVEALLTGPLT
jgi:molybdopterin molybdotransferase